jgi:hypothetical protein
VRRTATPLLAPAISAAIMAGLVLILGASASLSPAAAAPTRSPVEPFVDAGTCLDAALAPFAAAGAAGHARLCDDGHALRIAVEAIGLAPGEQYTVRLGSRFAPTMCQDVACRLLDRENGDPSDVMQPISRAVTDPTGVLELTKEIQDGHLLHGETITLQLVGELDKAGPYLQAQVVVP